MEPSTDVRILQRGHSPGDRTVFELVTIKKPERGELYFLQQQAGFHPKGYGGPEEIRQVRGPLGVWTTTWSCAGSCD